MSEKTMILIDGHALAFRSYFALERTGMKTTEMQPTWAVYGFFKAIFDMLKNKKYKFDCIAVTFDVSHQTFRVEKYEQYKANRASMPDALQSQMELIIKGLKAFNIPIYTKEGFEADDVIGTICKKTAQQGNKTVILTGDRDAFQLVDDKGLIKVLIPSKGELIEYNKQKVYEKMGVFPNQITDLKGLSGDKSDNIPGVQGIGDKTAANLLSKYKTIEEIYAHIDEIEQKGVREKLIKGENDARLSKDLATIRTNVDIDFDIDCAKLELPNFLDAQDFFKSLQFYGFLKNFEQIKSYFTLKDEPLKVEQNAETNNEENIVTFNENAQVQLGLFQSSLPKINTQFKKSIIVDELSLKNLCNKIKEAKVFAVNFETTSQNVLHTDLVGISIAINPQVKLDNSKIVADDSNPDLTESFYIPIFHKIGEQLPLDVVLNALKPIFEDENIKKAFCNVKLDINVLRKFGINLKGCAIDVALSSYVKDPARKHTLDVQAMEYLDYIIKPLDLPKEKGVDSTFMEEVSIETAADYTCAKAFAIICLAKYWLNNLAEKEKKLAFDIELQLAIVLAEMEWDGVSIDKEFLKKLSDELSEHLRNIEKEIYEIAGENFNIASPKQVAQILFEKLKITPPKTGKTKSGYSTNIQVLEQLAPDYPIVELVIEHRHLAKLLSTYLDALPDLIDPFDNRIHTSYNQTVTVTGRLSSSNPNLQNIPARTAIGNKIRAAFVPKNNDYLILSADYSQIELRLLAHYSKDKNLTEAFLNDVDVHTLTASKVFDVPEKDVTKEMRYKSKAVNFGIIYGQTRWGLASSLKISPVEAALFIDKYFATYPFVKKYMDETIATAYEKGYVETLYGRKRYLSAELHSSTRQIKEFAERAAINAPLQGSAADLIKLAMIDLNNKLKNYKSKIIMQVHDELVLEVEKSELDAVKKMTIESMELNQPLLVPLKVDINVSESWQE